MSILQLKKMYTYALQLKWMLPELALQTNMDGACLADFDADLRDILNLIDDQIMKLKEGK